MDKLSYGLGILLGESLKQQGFEKLVAADFVKSFEAVISGGKPEMTAEEANKLVQTHLAGTVGKRNLEAGQAYLTKNATRSEVVTLPSGMQYEILTSGNGPKPKATDKVTTHYHGTLIDGQVFDSSVQRGQPATFPVNGVIPGWVEALQLMGTGSKWRLFIPPHLAYGDRGAGQMIGPNATLVFDVELLSIA